MGNHFYAPGQQREVLHGDDQYYEDAAILFYGQAAVCDRCYDDYIRLRYKHPEPFVLRYLREQEEEDSREYQDSGYNTMSDNSYGTDKSSNAKYPDNEILRE
ncbi:11874_t:CDS:2, partial [Racocetra fulgida]